MRPRSRSVEPKSLMPDRFGQKSGPSWRTWSYLVRDFAGVARSIPKQAMRNAENRCPISYSARTMPSSAVFPDPATQKCPRCVCLRAHVHFACRSAWNSSAAAIISSSTFHSKLATSKAVEVPVGQRIGLDIHVPGDSLQFLPCTRPIQVHQSVQREAVQLCMWHPNDASVRSSTLSQRLRGNPSSLSARLGGASGWEGSVASVDTCQRLADPASGCPSSAG